MNKYTIRCTPEQTQKALNLGAPLEIGEGKGTILCRLQNYHTYKACVIPTAEEMIGWLEEQGIQIVFITDLYNRWQGLLYDIKKPMSEGQHIHQCNYVSTRKEATLAAIDAALEYLGNLKQ